MFRIICLAGFAGALVALGLIFLFYLKGKSIVIPYIIFFAFIAVFGVSAFLHIRSEGNTADDPTPNQTANTDPSEGPSEDADPGLSDPPSDPSDKADSPSPDELLAFDERTWSDFKILYKAHNNFMDAVQKYADGNVSAVSFYSYCEEMEKYFADASLSFFYGEADYQETYLSPFQSMALSDQMAAKSLIKYLDSLKISDLNEANKNIDAAKEAVTVIASNRGKLLAQAGLSDEEIREKVERDTADLG